MADPRGPRGRRARAHRGVPPPTAPADRRGGHPRPRRRRQGLGGAGRRRVPRRRSQRRSTGRLADAATLALPRRRAAVVHAPTRSWCSPAASRAARSAHLAVHGTVNDLAVSGARPQWLSAAFVLEEGFPVDELREIVADMAEAAAAIAGVAIVTGDTKVVQRGAADGLLHHDGRRRRRSRRIANSGPTACRRATSCCCSGTIGDHGMAVMLARGDLALEADIRSDTAAVGRPGRAAPAAAPSTRWMRDPTRGGVGTVCNELARDTEPGRRARRGGPAGRSGRRPARATCSASTRSTWPTRASSSRSSRRRNRRRPRRPAGRSPRRRRGRIGEIVADPEGIVVLLTSFGGTRIVDMLVGDPLPAIC